MPAGVLVHRDEAVVRLAGMLNGLAAQARTLGVKLAPFIGIACPGQIQEDGSILHGAQNLPGDWEAPFNLPQALGERLDLLGSLRRAIEHGRQELLDNTIAAIDPARA